MTTNLEGHGHYFPVGVPLIWKGVATNFRCVATIVFNTMLQTMTTVLTVPRHLDKTKWYVFIRFAPVYDTKLVATIGGNTSGCIAEIRRHKCRWKGVAINLAVTGH